MQKIIKVFLLLMLSGCALFEKELAEEKVAGLPEPPYQKLFDADYERVWRATQIVLSKYPIAVNNMDNGILETGPVRLHEGWLRPEHPPIPPGGKFYVINAQIARGRSPDNNQSLTRVRVKKSVFTRRDFFSAKEELNSDGLEEQEILYRIAREVEVDQGLEKVYQRMKKDKEK